MAKLDKVIESVLRESIVDDVAELVGIESEDAEARISGLSFANYLELGNAVDIEDVETAKEILGTVSPIEEEVVTEVAPPGMEGWIKKRKPEFKERYGDRWEEVLYATAWKQHNNESIEEGLGEKLLDKPTPTLKDLAKKHDMSLGDIGIQLTKGIKAEKEHTSDMLVAKEIALDHLNELPDYYTKLENMEEGGIKGKSPNKSKNYTRKGGNKQQYKWLITLNNGKTKTTWGDSRYNAIHGHLSPEQHIIGVKSAKKLKEADNPYASAPSQGSSIDALKAVGNEVKDGVKGMFGDMKDMNAAGKESDGEFGRKDVDELAIGDDIEVIDISGDPTAVTVKNPRGPGETLIVQTDKGEEHMIKKMAVSGTPQLAELAENFDKELEEMKAGDFDDSIRKTPLYVALFKITKVPSWAREYVEKGDLLYWNNRRDSLITVEGGKAIGLTATAVSFLGHYSFGDVLDGNFGKIEEDAIEESNIDGTDTAEELVTNVLAEYGLENLISVKSKLTDWGRKITATVDDVSTITFAMQIEQAMKQQFARQGKEVKRVIIRGNEVIVLMNDPASKGAQESIEEGEGDNTYMVYFYTSDNAPDWASWHEATDIRAPNAKEAKRLGMETIPKNEREFVKAYKAKLIKKFYGIGGPNMDQEVLVDGQNAEKTEHSGAKKGKGAYYGQKKTAKRDSNKKRRENDKKAISEDGSFFFFLDPDKNGGGMVMSSKGDIHDYYEDTETAMQEVRRLNAEFGKDQDGNPIGIKESVLSDHVKVEYKDPAGRFIVVTAGGAGHWAVGKGNPYGSGIEQWSHNNLDDAINQADADATDLDNLREMKRMAGIAETASGGATGAGAVATGVASVGGPYGVGGSKPIKRQISGNSSIYGKTTKKPKPKERAKESTEDGLGRNKK